MAQAGISCICYLHHKMKQRTVIEEIDSLLWSDGFNYSRLIGNVIIYSIYTLTPVIIAWAIESFLIALPQSPLQLAVFITGIAFGLVVIKSTLEMLHEFIWSDVTS